MESKLMVLCRSYMPWKQNLKEISKRKKNRTEAKKSQTHKQNRRERKKERINKHLYRPFRRDNEENEKEIEIEN